MIAPFQGSEYVAKLLAGKLNAEEYQAVMAYIRELERALRTHAEVAKAKKHPFIYRSKTRPDNRFRGQS